MALKDLISLVEAQPLTLDHPLLQALMTKTPPGFLKVLGIKPARNYYTHPDSPVLAFYVRTNSGQYMAFQAPVDHPDQVTPIAMPGTSQLRRWGLRTYAQDACRRRVAEHIRPGEEKAPGSPHPVVLQELRETLLAQTNMDRFEPSAADMLGILVQEIFRKDVPVTLETLLGFSRIHPAFLGEALANSILGQPVSKDMETLLNDLRHLLPPGGLCQKLLDGKAVANLSDEGTLYLPLHP